MHRESLVFFERRFEEFLELIEEFLTLEALFKFTIVGINKLRHVYFYCLNLPFYRFFVSIKNARVKFL